MKALVDGDIVAFRTAAAAEDADESICILRLDRFMREVLHGAQADTYEVYLTGENNFRKKIYPEYKANRKDKIPPKWLQQCREYLVKEWNAKISEGCEADDLLGIGQCLAGKARMDGDPTVICSIDKDLLQIPGKHYNFVKNEWFEQTYFGGMKFFYEQLLKGDRSDNIPGVAGLGDKKAARLLEGCETVQEMFEICKEQYNDQDTMLTYGKCLWIWRMENDIWNPNLLTGEHQLNLGEEEELNSSQLNKTENTKSSEPTIQETDGFPVLGT